MPITIILDRFEGNQTLQSTMTLEDLEDKLRQFLINECFDDFTIKDSYTGNELSSYIDPEDKGPGDVSYDEEGFVIERSVTPKEWTAYCDKCGKPFNPKDAVKIPYHEYPDASVSHEEVSPCCGTGFSDRPKEDVEQEELDAGERPVSQAKVEKESEEDIYECEHCNAEFKGSETLYLKRRNETGTIAFCPRCKQATKLIYVSDIVEARKTK